jgi:hypothetical protein
MDYLHRNHHSACGDQTILAQHTQSHRVVYHHTSGVDHGYHLIQIKDYQDNNHDQTIHFQVINLIQTKVCLDNSHVLIMDYHRSLPTYLLFHRNNLLLIQSTRPKPTS